MFFFALGAGSRRFKSSRPDQSTFETKLRKETATAEHSCEAGLLPKNGYDLTFFIQQKFVNKSQSFLLR